MISQRAYKLLRTIFWLCKASSVSTFFLNQTTLQLQVQTGAIRQWKVKLAYDLNLVYMLCILEILRRIHLDKQVNHFHLTVAYFLCVVLLTIFTSITRFQQKDAMIAINGFIKFFQHLHGIVIFIKQFFKT